MDALRRFPLTLALAVAGLVALSVVGVDRAVELTGEGRAARASHGWWIVLSAMSAVAAAAFGHRRLAGWSYAVYAVGLASLLLVFVFEPVNGAQRWLRLGPIGVQPSEFVKIAVILALARYLTDRGSLARWVGLVPPLMIVFVPAVLILREPDLGTACLLVPVLGAMLIVAGARWSELVRVGLVGVALVPVVWSQMSREQQSRVTGLFEQTGPAGRPTDDGYQLHQSKQMLALGGVMGSLVSGDAAADRTVYHLPAAHTDFIFSVIGERTGLVGVSLLFGLAGLVIVRGAAVAAGTREPYGRLLAVGIVSLIACEVMVNAGMAVGLLPVVGVSMPFVSYGGSGLAAHAIEIGLLIDVSLRPGLGSGRGLEPLAVS
jgi:cell division protein FtsW (lipid II flippase)